MAEEKQTFTGDSSQLQKEYDALAKRAEKLEEKLAKAAKTANDGNRQLTKEMRELNKTAKETAESVATPLEKYNARIAQLEKLMAAGKITADQYSRAIHQANKEMASSIREANKDLLTSGTVQKNIFDTAATNLTKMATGWLSVSAAIKIATAAHQDKLRIEREAAEAQKGIAASQSEILLSVDSPVTQKKMFESLGVIAQDAGVADIRNVYRAAAEALNMSGGDDQAALAAVRGAAQLTRHAPEQMGAYASGGVNIAKASGLTDMRQNFGLMLSLGQISPVKSPALLAENATPAIRSMTALVNDPDRVRATAEAAALFGTLSNAAADKTGAVTGTSAINFAKDLRGFFEDGISVGTGKKRQLIKPQADPGTLRGRIEALQKDEKLREAFLANTTLRAEYQAPIETLLRGGAFRRDQGDDFSTAGEFKKALGTVTFDAARYDEKTKGLASLTPQLGLATFSAAAAGNIQNAQLAATRAARMAESRRILYGTIDANSEGYGDWFRKQAIGWDAEVEFEQGKKAPESVAIDTLRAFQRDKTMPFWGTKQLPESQWSDNQRKMADNIEKQVKILQQMLQAAEQQANSRPAALAERGGHTER